jgi:putative phosphoesterase
MVHIALLSDTHGYLDDRFLLHLENSDEIWHAGDIGNIRIAEQLARIKPMRAVHGNIDGEAVRKFYPAEQRFLLEGMNVWIVHIGGYPGHYDRSIKERLIENPPDILITGHSHILRIQYDKKLQLLNINPGAAGKYGLHKVQTMVKFVLDKKNIRNMEVVELKRNNPH